MTITGRENKMALTTSSTQVALAPPRPQLNLRPGERVRVRPLDEIMATLDGNGALDGLPFMPEMTPYCGKTFTVWRRADKVCDTIVGPYMRRMFDTVHLAEARCDGAAHGGCQAGCMFHWREAWLERVDHHEPSIDPADLAPAEDVPPLLMESTRQQLDPEAYRCQATQMLEAAPIRLRWWDPRPWWRDVRSGNVTGATAVRGYSIFAFNKLQGFSRRYLPGFLRIKGAVKYPFVQGTLTKTPKETLNLQPGELVEVRPLAEIEATLNHDNKNRGLSFDRESIRYVGRQARVLRRVDRIIDEATGRMNHLGSDCLIIDGFICEGDYHELCPRSGFPYWREIWLRRVEAAPTPVSINRSVNGSRGNGESAADAQRHLEP